MNISPKTHRMHELDINVFIPISGLIPLLVGY